MILKRHLLLAGACTALAGVNFLSAQVVPAPTLKCWVSANPPTVFCCSLVMNTSRQCNSTSFNGGNTACPDQAISNGEVYRVTKALEGLSTISQLPGVTCQYQPKRCGGFLQDQCTNDGDPVSANCESMTPSGDECTSDGSGQS